MDFFTILPVAIVLLITVLLIYALIMYHEVSKKVDTFQRIMKRKFPDIDDTTAKHQNVSD